MPALQKQTDVAYRGGVGLVTGQTLDTRAQAPVDMILQARLGVESRQVHLARRHLEMPVDKVDQPVRQVGRKIWTEISRAVFPQPPRDVHPRIFLLREFD